MSNDSSVCTESHEHSPHCSGCAGFTIHHVCGKTPCAEADAQREPELSNAEIARDIVQTWDTNNAMCLLGDHEADLITNIEYALDAKDTRSRPTVAAAETHSAENCADCGHPLNRSASRYSFICYQVQKELVADIRRQAFDEAIAITEAVCGDAQNKLGLVPGNIAFENGRIRASDEIVIALEAARDAAPIPSENDSGIETT